MVLSKNQFFLTLSILVISPFFIYKSVWLLQCEKATGIMQFVGHGNLGSALGISSYPVIDFRSGNKVYTFNANINLDLKPGQTVSVLYQKNNPWDALVDQFICIWGNTIAYGLNPVLIIFVLFCTPEKFDPLIRKGAKVKLGGKPFFKIIPPTKV